MTSRTAYLSSFGLNIDALQSITNKVNIGSSTVQALAGWNHMDRLLGLQGLNEKPGHLRLAQQLQHQFLGRLSLQEYAGRLTPPIPRSEEHTSELQSLMRISYAVFCLKKKKKYLQ